MAKRVRALLLAAALVIACFKLAFAAPLATTVAVYVVPNAPSDLAAVSTVSTQVQLTWTDNSDNETLFSIERSIGASSTYIEIATTTANIASYLDNSVSAATTYFYRVRAFGGGNYSLYSDAASVTTPSNGGGGGGGGGGGSSNSGGGGGGYGAPPILSVVTNVLIIGSAYPSSTVTILKDGQTLVQIIAGPDGNFTAAANNLAGGKYVFSVYAQDDAGRRSTVFTFPVTMTLGATTVISGIFLSPTIDVDKEQVKKGDTITIFGAAAPSSQVSIQVDSDVPIFVNATSNSAGAYLYEFDSSVLEFGSHLAKAKSATGNLVSNYSISRAFDVGNENIAAKSTNSCPARGDINNDCHVNLVDFSVLAYWYQRPGFPPAYDLNGDGKVDLPDFSIMAYYWTG